MWSALSALLISFSIALLAVGWLARGPASRVALDVPNARSLHSIPVPRTGGIGLLLGIAAGWTVIATPLPGTIWGAIGIVIAVSLIDDLRGLSAAVRFAAHLLAAALSIFSLLPPQESPFLYFVGILAIGWMCNLYNFMDGSDGLAGGMAMCGFLTYSAAAWLAGDTMFAAMNLVVSASAAGFLVHNFHPARIFLGDVGSVILGFLAGVFGVMGWLQRDWTWWFPLLVFSPFIIDASTTLLRRAYTCSAIWRSHRDHYYQRLVQMGWGHRRTAIIEYALMGGVAIAALVSLRWSAMAQLVLIIVTILIYGVLIIAIEIAWNKRLKARANGT